MPTVGTGRGVNVVAAICGESLGVDPQHHLGQQLGEPSSSDTARG